MSWQDVKQDDLQALGFETFRDYLTSEHFRGLRVKALVRADWACWYCQAPANHVKFLEFSQRSLGGDDQTTVIAICTDCYLKCD